MNCSLSDVGFNTKNQHFIRKNLLNSKKVRIFTRFFILLWIMYPNKNYNLR